LSWEVEFEVPTWDQIYDMLLSLAGKIRSDNFQPDVIVGVSRGGVIPARVMSDLLENPKLASVEVEFYVGIAERKGKPVITQPVSTSVEGKKVLIIDDVADTGKTLYLVSNCIVGWGAKEMKTGTIYYKPWSEIFPDFYEKKTTRWVIFPWERKETVRNIVKKCIRDRIPVDYAKEKLIRSGLDPNLLDRFIKEIPMNEGK